MTSPRALLLSLAATVCGFVLALVAVVGQASNAATPVVESALAPSTVAVVAQEITPGHPVPFTVALEPATSPPGAWSLGRDHGAHHALDDRAAPPRGEARIDHAAATGVPSAQN